MNALLRIRKDVLGISQSEMAKIACTTQATISRWEKGELHPDLPQMALIREQAISTGVEWNDALFFDPPPGCPAHTAKHRASPSPCHDKA